MLGSNPSRGMLISASRKTALRATSACSSGRRLFAITARSRKGPILHRHQGLALPDGRFRASAVEPTRCWRCRTQARSASCKRCFSSSTLSCVVVKDIQLLDCGSILAFASPPLQNRCRRRFIPATGICPAKESGRARSGQDTLTSVFRYWLRNP